MDGPPLPEPERPAPAAPASGWVVPELASREQAADRPGSRVTLVLSWVAGLIIAGFGAWIATRDVAGSDAYRSGSAAGAFVTPFLIAAGVWLVVVRLRSGRVGRAALGSPWVPLGGALLAGVLAAGRIGSMVPVPPVDAETAMRVSAPFTLRTAQESTILLATDLVSDEASIRSFAVREVVGNDGSVSVLLATDGGLRSGELDQVAAGIKESGGVEPTIESIAGLEVAVTVLPDGAIGSWIEAPILMSVFAADMVTLRAVIEAVVGSG
jgi:hypothetical protein